MLVLPPACHLVGQYKPLCMARMPDCMHGCCLIFGVWVCCLQTRTVAHMASRAAALVAGCLPLPAAPRGSSQDPTLQQQYRPAACLAANAIAAAAVTCPTCRLQWVPAAAAGPQQQVVMLLLGLLLVRLGLQQQTSSVDRMWLCLLSSSC